MNTHASYYLIVSNAKVWNTLQNSSLVAFLNITVPINLNVFDDCYNGV